MPRRKRPKRLKPSVYLDYFTATAKAIRAAGFGTLPSGAILSGPETDRMDEYCETGKPVEEFIAFMLAKRSEERARAAAEAECMMGDETIHPSQAA